MELKGIQCAVTLTCWNMCWLDAVPSSTHDLGHMDKTQVFWTYNPECIWPKALVLLGTASSQHIFQPVKDVAGWWQWGWMLDLCLLGAWMIWDLMVLDQTTHVHVANYAISLLQTDFFFSAIFPPMILLQQCNFAESQMFCVTTLWWLFYPIGSFLVNEGIVRRVHLHYFACMHITKNKAGSTLNVLLYTWRNILYIRECINLKTSKWIENTPWCYFMKPHFWECKLQSIPLLISCRSNNVLLKVNRILQ